MKKYAPTPATATSVVSSSPSSPGISRLPTNRAGGVEHAHERADDPAVQRPADHEQRLDSGWSRCASSQAPISSRRRYAVTTPTITPTVTAKPNSAWPTRCCDLVERAPEDVAEDAEERGPRAAADDAVRDEAPVGEPGRAGDERRERAHEPDEAADQDRLAAVPVEVALHLLEPLVRDLHARAVLLEEARGRACGRCRSSWCRRARRRSRRRRSAGAARSRPGRRSRRRRSRSSRRARPGPRTRRSRGTPPGRPPRTSTRPSALATSSMICFGSGSADSTPLA